MTDDEMRRMRAEVDTLTSAVETAMETCVALTKAFDQLRDDQIKMVTALNLVAERARLELWP